MGYYRQFDEFDPLTGAPGEWPYSGNSSSLPSIVRRARALLKQRTREQLVNAARNADFFIEQYFEMEKESYDPTPVQIDGLYVVPYMPTNENTNEVDALKEARIGDWQLDDESESGFPGGHEYEYFAVLALWLVGDVTRSLNWPLDSTDYLTELARLDEIAPDEGSSELVKSIKAALASTFVQGNALRRKRSIPETVRFNMAASSALAAMDAVCYAEQLCAEEAQAAEMARLRFQIREVIQGTERLAEKKASRKISDNAKKAAMVKHKENHEMKVLVFDWCDSKFDLYPSMDAAAEAVAGKIVPVTFRTARDWIRDWGRSARRP